jgi:hypothetical protein
MSKFKVGDKVRCISSPIGFGNAYVGQIGTVLRLGFNGGIELVGGMPASFMLMDDWFELVTNNTTMSTLAKFKSLFISEPPQVLHQGRDKD